MIFMLRSCFWFFPMPTEGNIIKNTFSERYHLDAGNGRLKDGKLYPKSFIRLSAVPPGGRLCTKCF